MPRHYGFEEMEFELEPVAAAFAYEATLDRAELILIGDFGGGTSDFSLLSVGPEARRSLCKFLFGPRLHGSTPSPR